MPEKLTKPNFEWKKLLTPEVFHVTREKGTEAPFTGKYYDSKEKGIFQCVCCSSDLFSSEAKFNSGTGWPSFFKPASKDCIEEVSDNSLGMKRIEVVCNKCNAHLGHLFNDGPAPTGLRYCIISIALKLIKK